MEMRGSVVGCKAKLGVTSACRWCGATVDDASVVLLTGQCAIHQLPACCEECECELREVLMALLTSAEIDN